MKTKMKIILYDGYTTYDTDDKIIGLNGSDNSYCTYIHTYIIHAIAACLPTYLHTYYLSSYLGISLSHLPTALLNLGIYLVCRS